MVDNLDHLSTILNMIDFSHNLHTEYCFKGLVDHPFHYFIISSINVNPAAGLVYLNMLHIVSEVYDDYFSLPI